MSKNSREIISQNANEVLECLSQDQDWKPQHLGEKETELIGIRGDNLGIAASGCVNQPVEMYSRQVVAGFTVLRVESTPNVDKDEGDVNVDHYVLTEKDGSFRLHGPYRKQKTMSRNAGICHWPSYEEFAAFVDRVESESEQNARARLD